MRLAPFVGVCYKEEDAGTKGERIGWGLGEGIEENVIIIIMNEKELFEMIIGRNSVAVI